MREAVNPATKITIAVVSVYVFISELYWLIQTIPELLGPEGLNLWTPFIFRGLLFVTLIWSLIGRIAEHYELYAHEGMIADDIKFHFPRQALVFILSIIIVIKILSAIF
ncbi:MAG: hypothetical protein V1704_00020 [Candidatus Vogelbacteria bacterium]